jgi:diguanylate cyclase (GGDEF)-like protein
LINLPWSRRALTFAVILTAFSIVERLAVATDPWLLPPWVRLLGVALLVALLVALFEGILRIGLRRVRAMNDLARFLSRPFETAELLEQGLSTALQIFGAHVACVRIVDESGNFALAASRNVDPDYQREFAVLPPQSPAVCEALGAMEPVSLAPEALGDLSVQALSKQRIWTAMVVPLVAGGGIQGILTLGWHRPRGFIPNDLESFRTVGTYIGTAITNGRMYAELRRLALQDSLTGVSSRRHFEELYERELARARRTGYPLCLAMIDVDRFKSVNDTYGHQVGDRVLAAVGEVLRNVRAGDVVARYGGDEFVILMPDTTLIQAEEVLDRVREEVRAVNEAASLPCPLSLSIGVRELGPDADLLAEADAAMYRQKHLQSREAASLSATAERGSEGPP